LDRLLRLSRKPALQNRLHTYRIDTRKWAYKLPPVRCFGLFIKMRSIRKRCKSHTEDKEPPKRLIQVHVLIGNGIPIWEREGAPFLGLHKTRPLKTIFQRDCTVFGAVFFSDAFPGRFSIVVLHPHDAVGSDFGDSRKAGLGNFAATAAQEQ